MPPDATPTDAAGLDAPDTPETSPAASDAPSQAPAEDRPLGEAGEKALAIWKERAKKAEADAKRAAELEAELTKLREEQMTDHEKAIAQARREAAEQARAEALATVNERLFRSELKAATAGKLADPDLLADPDVAVKLLGFDEIPVTDSGDIDSEAISAAVASLLEAKPYLGAGSATLPSADQGARPSTKKRQLTRADLATMGPEEIDQARRDGLLDDLMAGKHR